ncbi:hypothetical protein QDR37_12215 [Amnibacterium sp. CER49]|uniref:hypothetical protein n=1 Tax=Amnibacterium sp. CER49 TaxID=3039161 RepID=UPI002446FCC5|nr:hypothetical protein [Amnibacterium sp. CER49]MDH2444711.1 hypothetical protein [Amnibacterium sp. CER49]
MSSAFAFDPVRRPTPASMAAAALLPAPLPPLESPLAPARSPLASPRVGRAKVLLAGSLVAGVGCVLAAQLVLSIGTADAAYRIDALTTRSVQLARQQQVGREQLQVLASPQHLAAAATALGMVQQDAPAYLELGSGRVLGSRTAATRGSAVGVGEVANALVTGR